MFVNESEFIQCIAEEDIAGAVNETLNASLLVEAGDAMGTGQDKYATGAKMATEDQMRHKIIGAVASIGPGNEGDITADLGVNRSDIFDGDIFAAQTEGKTRLILEARETVAPRTPLVSAGAGKVKAGTVSATGTVEELKVIVAYAEDTVSNAANDVGINVVLAL